MKQRSNHILRMAAAPRGFTLLELVVSMVVFSIALTGLVPLIGTLSRDLQPYKTSATSIYKCSSPARDGNLFAGGTSTTLAYEQHEWNLIAYDGDPWVRKLGAGARIIRSDDSQPSYTPYSNIPLQSPVLFLDNYNPSGGSVSNDIDGSGAYACPGWTYNGSATLAFGGDQHLKAAEPSSGSTTGEAVWSFKIKTTGWYSIQATWKEASDQVNNAYYYVDVGGTVSGLSVDQSAEPVGITSDGRNWVTLRSAEPSGLFKLDEGSEVKVYLSDVRANSPKPDTGTFVVADAVRIVQNTVKIESIERSLNGTRMIGGTNSADVTVHVSVTVNISQ